MGKLFFWLLVVAIFFLAVKTLARGRVPPPRDRERGVEDMVRCHVCGVNLPRSEAILSRGRLYCSQAHRDQDHSE